MPLDTTLSHRQWSFEETDSSERKPTEQIQPCAGVISGKGNWSPPSNSSTSAAASSCMANESRLSSTGLVVPFIISLELQEEWVPGSKSPSAVVSRCLWTPPCAVQRAPAASPLDPN